MRANIQGVVVEKRESPWDFNGRQGISYQLFVRSEGMSEAQAAQLIKCTPRQLAGFSEGDVVDVPVDIYANTVERQGAIVGAKLSVQLPADFDAKKAQPLHAAG